MAMNIFFNNVKRQYNIAGGYREFLTIAVPLVISTGIGAVQLLIGRTFLSWYSQNSFEAATPGGILNWVIECFFFGTLAYMDVFVARYYGEKQYYSIGPAIWQGVYLALVSACIVLCISFFAKPFFMNVGHPESVALEEIKFFKGLCYGAFPCIAEGTLAAFYSGRGKTKIVLLVSFCGVILNIWLDFCLIFGNFGLPEMGILGVAFANNTASTVICAIYMFLITTKKNSCIYNTRCMKFDFNFMKKLLRYGVPNGAELFFNMLGFGIFMVIIGSLGCTEVVASNIIATINHTFVMPIVGFGMATSIMVSNYLGRNQVEIAKKSVRSATHIAYIYVVVAVFILIFLPNQLIYPFLGGTQIVLEHVKPIVKNLLMILALYLIFNTGNIIFASAIKGAGDTVFVMKRLLLFSVLLVIIPTYLNIVVFKNGIYAVWAFLLIFVIVLAISFYFRYKSNKIGKIRII
jgi:MATE family multidrug resistance protein